MTQTNSRRLRLRLDTRNGWVAGVCAGIARRTGISRHTGIHTGIVVAIVRIATFVTALFLPTLVVGAYVAFWLVLDECADNR